MRGMLGMTTTLDVDRIDITRHALMRYLERRGRSHEGVESWADADRKLRQLLATVNGQRPPIYCANGSPVRRYTAAGFALVVSADHRTLITVYPWTVPTKKNRGGGRHACNGTSRSKRYELADWSDDGDWGDE